MSFLGIIVVLIVLGIVLTLLKPYIDPPLYRIIIILVILAVVLWIVYSFGIFDSSFLSRPIRR
jgi:hypothetical protein